MPQFTPVHQPEFMREPNAPVPPVSAAQATPTGAGQGNGPGPPTLTQPSFNGGGQGSGPTGRVRGFLYKHRKRLTIGALIAVLVLNLGLSAWLFHRIDRYSALSAVGLKQSGSSNTFNGDDTLFINTKNKSVGVGPGLSSPEGLQVGSTVTDKARGAANVREGLLSGQPAILLEDKSAQQWEISINGAALQFAQPGAAYAQIDKTGITSQADLKVLGNTTLGDASSDTVTLQAGSIAIPNNLNIGNNALFVDAAHGAVAIGATSASGYKLYVSGSARITSSLQVDSQIILALQSAKTPSITFAGNTNTGIYSAGANSTSVSAGGTETLRVSPGTVSTLNGANLSITGFTQAGGDGNNPSWKIARYTGTLDGSGTGVVAHGISNAPSRVIMAMGWYEGTGGQAKALSVDLIDGTNMQVSGGVPGNVPFRAMIMYTSDTAGW